MQRRNTVRLQGIGEVDAIPAGELQPGMRIMWNAGHTSYVTKVDPLPDGNIVRVTFWCGGKEYVWTFRMSRLVAAYWPKESRKPS